MPRPRYLIVAEAAEILGCSPRTVQRLAEQGRLPFEDKLPGPTGPYLFSRTKMERVARQRRKQSRRMFSRSTIPAGIERDAGRPDTASAAPGTLAANDGPQVASAGRPITNP